MKIKFVKSFLAVLMLVVVLRANHSEASHVLGLTEEEKLAILQELGRQSSPNNLTEEEKLAILQELGRQSSPNNLTEEEKRLIERQMSGHFRLVTELPDTATSFYFNDGLGNLAKVDVRDVSVDWIGNTGFPLTDIAFDPSANLYGLTFDKLWRVDQTTAAATLVGSHGIPGANSLVFGNDGTLYAGGANTRGLYTINPNTASSNLIGDMGFNMSGDLAFHNEKLYGASYNPNSSDSFAIDYLLEINASTGAGTLIGSIGPTSVFGLASPDNGILYGVAGTSIFSINTTTGSGFGTQAFDYRDSGSGLGNAWGATSRVSLPSPPPPPPDDEEPPPPVHPLGAIELQDGTPFSSENDAPPLFSSITGTGLWTLWNDGSGAQFRQGITGFDPGKPTVVLVHGWQPDNRHGDWTAEDPLLPYWIRETANITGIDQNRDNIISAAERTADCTVRESCPDSINMDMPTFFNGHELNNPDTVMPQLLGNRDDINVLAWNWTQIASTSYSGFPKQYDKSVLRRWPGLDVPYQGLYLSGALKKTFGVNYEQPLQLIGQSLGGGVVSSAGLQLERFGYKVDQLTFFDVPEGRGASSPSIFNNNFDSAMGLDRYSYGDVLLNQLVDAGIWIDNYPTAFGKPYPNFAGEGDIVNVILRNGDGTHGYPFVWYFGINDYFGDLTIPLFSEEGTLAGGNGFPSGYPSNDLGAYWSKVLNPFQSDLVIDEIRQELGRNSGYYVPDNVNHPYTLLPTDAEEARSPSHPVRVDIGDVDLWVKKGDVYFVDGDGTFHMTTSSPVFLFREFDFPQDSQYLSFDFFLENPTPEDQLAFLIGHDYFFRYEGAYFPEDWNSFLNSGPIDVSGFAGTNQWLTFLYDSEEKGHRAQIANINLYRFEENTDSSVVPEPSTLALLGMGLFGGAFRFRRRSKLRVD